MNLTAANLIYFSPTNTTQKVVRAIGAGTGLIAREYDFTHLLTPPAAPVFKENELVVIGAPVYVGRVPAVTLDYLRSLQGTCTPCVLIGLYGNRAFDDFLLELEDLARERGFIPVAAAAFIGEHSFSNQPAGGRPNSIDLAAATEFGSEISKKIKEASAVPGLPLGSIPGNRPYRAPFRSGGVPFAPVVSENCASCGACASACPTGAISRDDVRDIEASTCIRCRACAQVCPNSAIDFAEPSFWEHTEQLVKTFGGQSRSLVLVI